MRERVLASQLGSDGIARLDIEETKLNKFDGEPTFYPFEDVLRSDVHGDQKMFQALATASSSPRTAKGLMAATLRSILALGTTGCQFNDSVLRLKSVRLECLS